MSEINFNQSFIAFSIRQGGLTHDRIKELNVVDVVDGNVNEVYHYNTNPENLAEVWIDLVDCFARHEYAVAYNLTTHRSNLEKSLIAVGVTPPAIKYLCVSNWVDAIPCNISVPYFDAESVVDIVKSIFIGSGQTIADRYAQIHTSGRSSTSNYFRGFTAEASLDGIVWLNETLGDFSLEGKVAVITGDFVDYPDRASLSDLLKNKGAKVVSDITGKTNLVIVGSGPGPSKMDKVRKNLQAGKNIVCINELLLKQIL